jgi:hypothetical protein
MGRPARARRPPLCMLVRRDGRGQQAASLLPSSPLSLIYDAALPCLAACSARRSNRGTRRCRRRACRCPACPAPGLRRHRPCRELESRAKRLCRRRARLHEHEGPRERREGPLRVMPTSFSPRGLRVAACLGEDAFAVGGRPACALQGPHASARHMRTRAATARSTRLTPASPRHSFSLERPCRSSAPRGTPSRCRMLSVMLLPKKRRPHAHMRCADPFARAWAAQHERRGPSLSVAAQHAAFRPSAEAELRVVQPPPGVGAGCRELAWASARRDSHSSPYGVRASDTGRKVGCAVVMFRIGRSR